MHRYYAECKKRASLVPAAAVIPALRAYIKVVAFKTPVVEIAWWGLKGGFFLEGKGRRGQEKRRRVRRVCVCVCAHIHHRACASGEERKEKEGEKRKRVCSLLRESAFNFSTKPLSLSLLFGSRGFTAQCVCGASSLFYCPPSPLQDNTPLAAPPMSFVTIKKLECL